MRASSRRLGLRLLALTRKLALLAAVPAGVFAVVRALELASLPERAEAASGGPSGGPQVARFGMAPTVDPRAPLPGELSRRILALYDSSETLLVTGSDEVPRRIPTAPDASKIHRLTELPLNHLGLVLDWLDVDQEPLPDAAAMARYRGVLTWFDDDTLRDPAAYLVWLGEQMRAGRRVVVLEQLGAARDPAGNPAPPALVERVFAQLGGRDLGRWTDDGSVIGVVDRDPSMVGFERALPAPLHHYAQIQARPGMKVALRLRRMDLPNSESDMIWTGPTGGFVGPTLVVDTQPIGDRWVTRWVIDPFRFFERAFALEDLPRFDFTTQNGLRLFYAHVDGDGFDTISELDHQSTCGELMRDRIFSRHPLPFTASVIVGVVAPPPVGVGSPRHVEAARSMFALDNIDIGSHGMLHPIDWRLGDRITADQPNLSIRGVDYPPESDAVGRSEREIAGSVAWIDQHLAPPGKRCEIMLWTGTCNPSADQLAIAYQLGIRNINGGDGRMDDHYPSYAHLAPPMHRVGGYTQFFTSDANDFIYTDRWTPPYFRYKHVIQTFESTGAPRRVLPVNVYVHFYLVQNAAGFAAFTQVLDWVEGQPLAPVHARAYVDVVRDFGWARIARAGTRGFRVEKGSALRTLRFDDPRVGVDVARSEGVVGFAQVPELGATYVHLDESTRAKIELGQPDAPYVERGTHAVERFRRLPRGLAFVTHGVGRRWFEFAGFPGDRGIAVSVGYAGGGAPKAVERGSLRLRSTADGRVRVELGEGGSAFSEIWVEEVGP